MNPERELSLADAFVELADTLVDEFDVIDFLQQLSVRCAQLLDVSAAAVLLAPDGEPLRPVAPFDPGSALAELLDAAADAGPALDCHLGGAPPDAPGAPGDPDAPDVTRVDLLGQGPDRWGEFVPLARRAGYTWASALPMRLRGERLGCLLLLRTDPAPPSSTDVRLGQALADAATIGLVHEQTLRAHRATGAQLRGALHSRIVIEQAKGILAARLGMGVDEAFAVLRRHARSNSRRLTEVARQVIDEGLVPAA
ncbi:transcriptional regulator [Streptomyces spiroverticillatus]|uniref:Transcriptional regulator n=1 Tax=Streptomyces finlayi TaxID=67296 RepID=A0A919C847_9ACTN|nr:ANTAR domain-containing protein [Streptomyces finlayi]GGZ98339.1 transcriptional regulator [Streptomyces spiroverticillatus]GHC83257.1 transcriptional regulator [Streptomyces finlayi]